MTAPTQRLALYPGTFDGLTNGHLDIIRRAAGLFDRLCVAIARNESKKPLFTAEERMEILAAETAGIGNVDLAVFNGLTVDYAARIGALCIVRGIRVISDFEYELQMAQMNRRLNPEIETVFMFPQTDNMYVSSSLIKEAVLLGADVSPFVPASTANMMRRKLLEQTPEAGR